MGQDLLENLVKVKRELGLTKSDANGSSQEQPDVRKILSEIKELMSMRASESKFSKRMVLTGIICFAVWLAWIVACSIKQGPFAINDVAVKTTGTAVGALLTFIGVSRIK